MMQQLADTVWQEKTFHEEAATLLQTHLKRALLQDEIPLGQPAALNRLARSAAILSSSNSTEQKTLAYRLAAALAVAADDNLDGLKHILLVVLSRLGNFPGAAFAESRLNILNEQLPQRLFGENEFRKDNNTVLIAEESLVLTDFQIGLWRSFENNKDVSVSAPTSAGKSYAIQQFIRRAVIGGGFTNCVFVVPSRALITQVTDDVSEWMTATPKPIDIISIPLSSDAKLPSRAIYIMTQERLQLTLYNHKSLTFEIGLVDESPGPGEGPRGILLTNVIDECRERNPGMKLLFAGPNIANPRDLGIAFGIQVADVSTRDQTVAQNIIFADIDAISNKTIKLSYLAEGKRVELGTVEAPLPLLTERDRFVFVPILLGTSGQSLIYVMGPAQCEDIAFGIADATESEATDYLNELSAFIADSVHPKFQLVNTVKSGVGFHYGRVPSLVRKEIEEAYSNGHLKYLVTTSTLLQGVNLPARNLFMLKPQRGDNNPISSIDFWNLAGRAGRLGKEFEGNVFLIDYDTWKSKPLDGEKEARVENSFDVHLRDQTKDLIAYLSTPAAIPDRDQTDQYENTFVKLYSEYRRGTLERRLQHIDLSENVTSQIIQALQNVEKSIDLPDEIFQACPTVSPYRQQFLLDRLRKSLKEKGPSYVIPVHPLAPNSYQSMVAAFKRCQDEILRYPTKDKSYMFVAYLASRWMRGDALPKIIEDSLNFKRKAGGNPNIPTVIRQTLTDIEYRLRFEYVRLMTCYNAVLKFALEESGHEAMIPSIPAIPIYLEVGACTPTMMSFMELGVSRYTSSKLHLRPARSDLNAQAAKNWLTRQDLDALDIPRASANEIRRLGLTR